MATTASLPDEDSTESALEVLVSAGILVVSGEQSEYGFARPVERYEETMDNGRKYLTNDYGPDGEVDNTEPARPTREGGLRRLHSAVAVTAGFDDDHDGRAVDGTTHRLDVA